MSDIRSWSREFVREFITEYRMHPCLWKIKSKDYSNRTLKRLAYNRLVDLSRKVFPEANREWVVGRIQSLRGSFRKELNKTLESKRSGAADSVHVPSLWYYDLLKFIKDQEGPTESYNCCDELSVETHDTRQRGPEEPIEMPVEVHEQEETSDGDMESDAAESYTPTTFLKRKRPPSSKRTENQKLLRTLTEAIQNTRNIDEFEAVGVNVIQKLKKMTDTQRIYAESLIHQVLTKGLLQCLSSSTELRDLHGASENNEWLVYRTPESTPVSVQSEPSSHNGLHNDNGDSNFACGEYESKSKR